jgi:hypothetical protein
MSHVRYDLCLCRLRLMMRTEMVSDMSVILTSTTDSLK